MTTHNQASGDKGADWRLVGMILLCVRFVQGWIYWGGGSRRFIYAPQKLNPHAAHWMANKFQTAMPGAILGMDKVVDFLLRHFHLLYAGIIIFSAVELIVGLCLIFGFMTRASALASMGLSFVLMLLFGWQGATCIDEWTMASANFAMGAALLLGGAGAYSIDAWLMRKKPRLAASRWFACLGSGAQPENAMRAWSKWLFVITVLFVVSTYHYYRGSVFTPFHGGPVSPSKHHVTLTNAKVLKDGTVSFHAYLDGGTPAVPAHIARVQLKDAKGNVVETWNGTALAALPKKAFDNDYIYNKFGTGFESISAPVGAKATVTLPPAATGVHLDAGIYTVSATLISGKSFSAKAEMH